MTVVNTASQHISVNVADINSTNTILTDVDGVLLGWSETFDKFMKEEGYTKKPNTDHHYRLSLQYPELSDKQTTALVEKFNTSEYIRNLPPWRDSVKYVRKLSEHGYTFICITALSEYPLARDYRIENLNSVFGEDIFNHNSMICLPIGMSKHGVLKQWAGSQCWWIEDHFRHAESGHELGLRSILMDEPHNAHFNTDLFPRVKTWKEIYDLIISDL